MKFMSQITRLFGITNLMGCDNMADWNIVDDNREEGFFISSLNYGDYFEIMQKYHHDPDDLDHWSINTITLSRSELLSLGERINEIIRDTSRVYSTYGDKNGSNKR